MTKIPTRSGHLPRPARAQTRQTAQTAAAEKRGLFMTQHLLEFLTDGSRVIRLSVLWNNPR